MRFIVTDKLTRRWANVRTMIEIELPCCGNATHLEELTDVVGCETCGVALELGDPTIPQTLSAAA
jgi:hypothetical protein